MANLAMWSILYSPKDMVYNLVTNKAVYIVINLALDLNRTNKIMKTMRDARKVYPRNGTLVIILGVIKANGATFMKPVTR